ncbi:MAG: 3-phosphoshikimate 1-carboxyvinyltransferase [Bacteroidales bacterium]|nr:3-phosphoshikimate 1-carboxyvinyltransferase [Bacteroidales bacterium]
MICVTIQNKTLEEIFGLLENSIPSVQMAEIRLDRCPLDIEGIEELFSYSDTPLIATCRVAGDGSGTWEETESKLMAAIEAGAAFVDLEIEAPKEIGKRLRRACNEHGTTMIRSCHFFEGVPSEETLFETAERCKKFGGEVIKVVAMAKDDSDVERLMSLYDKEPIGRLVAFAMGEAGKNSRISCLEKGAPFTYAALSEDEAAAPGQWPYSKMTEKVYGERKPLPGTKILGMPSSKSFAQRAIIAAALADGTSCLGGYSSCGDNEAALKVAVALGADVTVEGTAVTVTNRSLSSPKGQGPSQNLSSLHMGESGLLTRLMIPLVAAMQSGGTLPKIVDITGEGTLPNRPLKGATEIMARFGTVVRPLGDQAGELKVPLSVQGPLLPGKNDISGKDGSQLISGLLMALPLLQGDSTIHVHDPKSIPYMFITIDVLRKFGIRIGSEMEGDEEFMENQDWSLCTGVTFKVKGGQKYIPASFDIEGDWSAAANFLVAGAVFGKVQLSGLDTSSLQADISIMDILMEAGASLSQMDETGVITAQRAPLRAFDTDLNNCPDLFPAVSIMAAFCNGESHILGFKRLASKESDRGKAILETLGKMGVGAHAEGDCLTIEGQTLESRLLKGNLLKGGNYSSFHDHRMAMALTVASLGADSPIVIDDTACVAKSFPAFYDIWGSISE